jgi:Cellulose biosynthesis protein BcsS
VHYFSRISLSTIRIAIAALSATGLVSSAHAADMATKAPPPAASPAFSDVSSSVFWLGGDFKTNVAAGTAGGIYALNGNLAAPGWLVRGQFTYVGYDFASTLAPSGTAHSTFADGSGAIGYQVFGNGLVASGFVGVDYQNYTTNPAAAASTGVGDKWGAVFIGRVATIGGTPYPFDIDGSYSTANNSFWIRGRPGVRFGNLRLGPEVIGLGNNVFDEVRVGGYASYDVSRNFIVQADLGYADPTRGENTAGGRGGRGAYGGVVLVFLH